jgi:hypothetical protein
MKSGRLLVTAVLAIAIGAPIAGLVGDINMAQTVTSTGVRVPFLHGLLTAPLTDHAELDSLELATSGSIRRP